MMWYIYLPLVYTVWKNNFDVPAVILQKGILGMAYMIIGVCYFVKYWGRGWIRGRKNSLRGIKIVELRPCVTPQNLAWAWVQFKSIKKKKKWQWNWLKVRCCKSGGVWLLGKSWKSLLLRLPTEYLIMLFSLTLKETSSLVNTNLDYCFKKKKKEK